MSVMIEIPIPDDLVAVLERKATSTGLKREEYVAAILSRELLAPSSLDEVLAKFREQLSNSGFSDSELTQSLAAARDEVRAKKTTDAAWVIP